MIYLVYQDCPTCKLGLSWADILKKANELGLEAPELLPYFAKGAKELILEAKSRGFTMPFFTDGEKFGDTLAVFAEKNTEKAVKTAKSAKKSQKSSDLAEKVEEKDENGASSEDN